MYIKCINSLTYIIVKDKILSEKFINNNDKNIHYNIYVITDMRQNKKCF